MLIAKATKSSESGEPPTPALMGTIGQFAEEMMKAGVLVDQGGPLPSAAGARVRASGGTLTVVDGPFAETKELVGGYAVVDVPSRQDAIELSKRFLPLHIEATGPSDVGESEVRQMFEMPQR